ncbi:MULTISPECIES: hypothetical protein [Brevibacillus]|jgi:hypothetical protein|uniref:hypothetical protein n=1 Tax=Brevibacillus TaxID=55080 RepID=UPI00046A44BB|nr:hypothetical protein [Brevibacillus borstelensis]MCC0564970.1 hypothetical protein [Brevibacillus borstelensis]MCM3469200.1 hypothetical protein [Brevibacillus borstelensis]MCM3560089.1 hypothetical protein [Brevibacillus borstelensis]MCM3589720.1 hypothetical protein [Brevibacillus borstelensis]MCM3623479.1 hypothetical protein [Brevibacillus borstelensis]
MRDVQNRYQGLPPRTPEMLYNIVRKFYRGAVNHYDLIQEKKADVKRALAEWTGAKEDERQQRQQAVNGALTTLFLEFHFYVTCWLQIEMALYRLAKNDERHARIMEQFRGVLETHVNVRHYLEQPEKCVDAQWEGDPKNRRLPGAERDLYQFGEILFTVDNQSLESLHALYEAIAAVRAESE